ncbi:hypothetical protein RND81_14G085400 [Saponaria officinalis]|uniref:KIB1-4 beta-propeller domain-containing protein n=2 Tax=Saponaria officinalis TaxID=3572 RepID=A0AAW1GJA3_SAPOF
MFAMDGNNVLVPCKRGKLSFIFIPDHICEVILGKLKPLSKDYFRFGCVSKQWFSILMQDRERRRRLHHTNELVPLLALPSRRHNDGTVKAVVNTLFSIIDKTTTNGVDLRLTYDVGVDDILNYCGSSYGWLCYFLKSYEIVLCNPFAAVDNVIRLPPIMRAFDTSPVSKTDKALLRCWQDFISIPRNLGFQYAVRKIVLSADPRTALHFLIVAIYTGCDRLAFFNYTTRPTTTTNFPSWTYFDQDDGWGQFSDVIFHQGLLYACGKRHVFVIKVDTIDYVPVFQVCAKIDMPILNRYSISPSVSYLTVTTSTKELLLIVKLLHLKSDNSLSLKMFRVFKLAKNQDEELRWVNVTNLDGDAVFVGFNHTLSVVASASTGCLPDSIYFTDDCPYISRDVGPYGSDGPVNMGVVNLNNKSECKRIRRLPNLEQLPMPPIWILPMF